MAAALVVYRWELRKLRSQKRTYLGLWAASLVPLVFVVALACATAQPNDVAFGRYVHESGLAIPLVLLLFGSNWLFPLITALVAGDIVASEDHNGTLKTILTRSLDRGQIFTGKALAATTYAITALLVSARSRPSPARSCRAFTRSSRCQARRSPRRRRSGWSIAASPST